MLDPHEASLARAKPLKKGKTWRQAPVAGLLGFGGQVEGEVGISLGLGGGVAKSSGVGVEGI